MSYPDLIERDETKTDSGLRVAYFGVAASNTHAAAQKHFGAKATFVPTRTIADVFAMTERGETDFGVVPVENSIEGAVTHTLDMFSQSQLQICAEEEMPIAHHLLMRAAKGVALDLSKVRAVYSHPQALGQCRNWLARYLPNATLLEASSTAHAAEMAARSEPPGAVAAIANALAAETYNLTMVRTDIQDIEDNQTRFLIIGREAAAPTGSDKTGVMISIKDRVGALYDILSVFMRYGINLTRLESRPSKQKAWDYVFFIDFPGHPTDKNVAQALEHLQDVTVWVKVLGSWPRK